MERREELREVEPVLAELNYPIEREAAARELAFVTFSGADGNVALGALVAGAADNEFDSVDDVLADLPSR